MTTVSPWQNVTVSCRSRYGNTCKVYVTMVSHPTAAGTVSDAIPACVYILTADDYGFARAK
jgi:hypothetical protein